MAQDQQKREAKSIIVQLLTELGTLTEDLSKFKGARSERVAALKSAIAAVHSVSDARTSINSKPHEVDSQEENLLHEISETTKKWLKQLSQLEVGSAGERKPLQISLSKSPAEKVPQRFSEMQFSAPPTESPLSPPAQRTGSKGLQAVTPQLAPLKAVPQTKAKAGGLQARMKARAEKAGGGPKLGAPGGLGKAGGLGGGLQLNKLSLKTINQETPTYRSDDGLRKIQDSISDIAKPASTVTEKEAVIGTSQSDFKPVVEHGDNIWCSGISAELEKCIENLSYTLFGLPFSVSIAIPSITDTPLIGISEGFLKLSGYSREEIVGQNCRLLLRGVPKEEISEETRKTARRYCRAAHLRNLTSMSHSFFLQRNARRNGELFWNYFMLTIIPGPDKRTYIIGLQLDLGPNLELPKGQVGPTDEIVAEHRNKLTIVQKLMFGINPESPIDSGSKEAMDEFMGLSDDISAWLTHAEARSAAFQKWGTKPFVAWPGGSRYALLNGGTTLLRLEADTIAEGATAMTIFSAARKVHQCAFKIRVDEVCERWPQSLQLKAKLPTMGFTIIRPADMDALGGLPTDLKRTPSSVQLFGDGSAHISAELGGEEAWCTAQPEPAALLNYKVKAGDTLECTWGKGFIRMEANGELLYQVKDPAIVGIPQKTPVYGLIDCCYAACRLTLMA